MSIPEHVKMGKNSRIDKDTVIGYIPSRQVKLKTVIGDNAFIRSGTVIYAGSVIGRNLETGHNVVIREENKIGNNFSIWNNSVVDYGCKIGNNVKIHSNCYVAQYTTIENSAFLSPGVILANDIHPGCKFFRECMKGPVIKKEARIGINSTILPFIEIGEKSLIGAGSVVTKNIPKESYAYGNPARVVGSIYDLKCIKNITTKPYEK
jgi:acetyltransferase-like isoleucine patch superfamily enzyme